VLGRLAPFDTRAGADVVRPFARAALPGTFSSRRPDHGRPGTMLSYSSHEAGGVLVFTAEKSAEGEGLSNQREWIYKTIETREDPRFAIDLGAIEYMSSSEIGFLITLRRRIDARQGKVVLFRLDSFIFDILRTMRLDKLFLIADDLSDALVKLSA
jgi:anti-sigma B factor antagonist